MKKVDIKDLTKKINEFRIANNDKSFTASELYDALYKLGFNDVIVHYLTKCFPYKKLGTSKLFSMPKDPIHTSVVESYYKKQRNTRCKSRLKMKISVVKESTSEDKDIDNLKKKGYRIYKCVGFDLERFIKENPEMYNKYLKYELI